MQTCYEAWLAMQTPSNDGLISSDVSARRWTTVPIYNASDHEAVGLERLWQGRTPKEAHRVLSRPDVTVTNASDKHIQLGKLEGLDERVRKTMLAMQ